jgi:hypothetical protein
MMFTEQSMPVTGAVMTRWLSATAMMQDMPTIGEEIMIAGYLITVLTMVTEDTDVLHFMATAVVARNSTVIQAEATAIRVADMAIRVADMEATAVVDMEITVVADMAADTADINHYQLILTGFPKMEACFCLDAI